MKKQNAALTIACIGMLLLILDTQTASAGMIEGIEMCLYTLIPSLFPFILLSTWITGNVFDINIPFASRLARLLNIPGKAVSIFLIGLLGGYPVGAQSTAQAVNHGHISRENGSKMLAFCSNAGPAFLFGIGTCLLPNARYCWILWAIHICSAAIVGRLTPLTVSDPCDAPKHRRITLAQALRSSTKTMAYICGWVTIFRVVLQFMSKWFLWHAPKEVQLLIAGILELANGSCSLIGISSMQMRCKIFSLFLGLGGICVTMQTVTVCEGLSIRWYIFGKLTQGIISYCITAIVISQEILIPLIISILICVIYYFLSRAGQNTLAFSTKSMYNKENIQRGYEHAISQKHRTPMRILQTQHATH